MYINQVSKEKRDEVIAYYKNKPLTEKKGFFPQRVEFKWVKINAKKALNDLGYLTDYAKTKLLEQNLKGEMHHQGAEPYGKQDIADILAEIKSDMIAKGAW